MDAHVLPPQTYQKFSASCPLCLSHRSRSGGTGLTHTPLTNYYYILFFCSFQVTVLLHSFCFSFMIISFEINQQTQILMDLLQNSMWSSLLNCFNPPSRSTSKVLPELKMSNKWPASQRTPYKNVWVSTQRLMGCRRSQTEA